MRSDKETAEGMLEGSLHIPHFKINDKLKELEDYKDKPIIVYCRSGRRASIAKRILEKHEFLEVYNAGGYEDLVAAKPGGQENSSVDNYFE